MASISGTMKLGEADATRRDIARRFQMEDGYLVLVAMVMAGAGIGAVVLRGPGMAIGVACAFVAYWSVANRFARQRYRKQLIARGFPAEIPVSMAITPDALTYDVADVRHIAKWNAVTELFASRGHWLFMVQAVGWALPSRLFADKASERAFIAAALQCMSEEARGRSGTAQAFIAAT